MQFLILSATIFDRDRSRQLLAAGANGGSPDIVSEGHHSRRIVGVHQVRFDEEAVVRVNDIKICRERLVGAYEGIASTCVFESAHETTVDRTP
jgi:hypothetical protein